jgi:hypothetical protein
MFYPHYLRIVGEITISTVVPMPGRGDSDAGVPGRELGVEGLGPTIQDGLGRLDLNVMSITHHMGVVNL